jgi:chemotaxis protein histidine kinase CheA
VLFVCEQARDFLESGLEVCETAKEFATYCAIRSDKTTIQSYAKMQASGVGNRIIIKFFGGSWSGQTNAVTESLKILNANRDLEKAELAEEAAKKAEVAAEKLRREQDATRKAEEAKAAAAEEVKAKAEAKAAKAAADKNAKVQATARAEARKAEKAQREADANAKRAAAAADKAKKEADSKRKAATKAHADKHRVAARADRDTFEGFKTLEQASKFTTASGKLDMTAAERVKCGAYVIKHEFSARQISTAVDNWFSRNTVAGRKAAEKVKRQDIINKGDTLDSIIAAINADIPGLAKRLIAVEPHIENIQHAHIKSTFEKRILNELAPAVSKLVSRLHAMSAVADSINPSK